RGCAGVAAGDGAERYRGAAGVRVRRVSPEWPCAALSHRSGGSPAPHRRAAVRCRLRFRRGDRARIHVRAGCGRPHDRSRRVLRERRGCPVSRRGAALALTLVLLVVLECVVIGTMHLALQEHRIGANRVTSLALRLEVENAVRRALGYWSASIDSMATGPEHRIPIAAAATGLASASVERLNAGLYIVRGEAREAPPRVGRAVAQLLVMPPLIGADVDPTPAPL